MIKHKIFKNKIDKKQNSLGDGSSHLIVDDSDPICAHIIAYQDVLSVFIFEIGPLLIERGKKEET